MEQLSDSSPMASSVFCLMVIREGSEPLFHEGHGLWCRRGGGELRHFRQARPLAAAFGLEFGLSIDAALGNSLADLLRADRPVFQEVGPDDFVVVCHTS
jgi:hypothetical protein